MQSLPLHANEHANCRTNPQYGHVILYALYPRLAMLLASQQLAQGWSHWLRDLQDNRMIEVGRHLWRLCSNPILKARSHRAGCPGPHASR